MPATAPSTTMGSPAPTKAAPKPSKVDAASPNADNYSDSQIKTWELMSKRPIAKKYGMDTVFQQKIADRRARLSGWADMANKGYPIEKISAKDRSSLIEYMKVQGLHPEVQRLRPEYVSGLNVLHVSLFGTSEFHDKKTGKLAEGANAAQAGLADYIHVLDSNMSKWRIAAVPELYNPAEHPPGAISNLLTLAKVKAVDLQPEEKQFIIQLNRAIGAINSLRTVTGLPRATQQLMIRYALELPNVVMDDSNTAQIKLLTIQREIEAALKQGSSTSPMTATTEEAPPPPPGAELDQQ